MSTPKGKQKAEIIIRNTYQNCLSVAITTPTLLLKKNPYRISYYIQNHDGTNYVAVSPSQNVTAGTYATNEGWHIHAGGDIEEDSDQDQVWIVANTASCYVEVVEITDVPTSLEKDVLRTIKEVTQVGRMEARVL